LFLVLTFQYADGPGTRGENSMLSTSAPKAVDIGGMGSGSDCVSSDRSAAVVERFLVVVRKRDRNETDFLVAAQVAR
jgi:hypothetical protein